MSPFSQKPARFPFSLGQALHHVTKFFKLNFSVPILINFTNKLIQSFVLVVRNAESSFYFCRRYCSRTIFVKQAESCLQLLLTYEVFLAHGSHHKLSIVYCSVLINVYCLKHLIDLLLCHLDTEMFFETFVYLFLIQSSIAIFVHHFEYFFQISLLFPMRQMTGNKGHCGLLYLLVTPKTCQIFQSFNRNFIRNSINICHLLNPRVI